MSEPIIIETTTTTRERLVLVPPDAICHAARDATPDDLARGGYVPVERAEKAEWSARVARMALANERQDREGVRIRKDLGTQDASCPCDTDPEQGMGMNSPPCPLHEAARALRRKTSWEDAAHTMDGELKAAIARAEKAERELAEVREAAFNADSGPGEAPTAFEAVTNLRLRADQAERELDGACSPECQARIDYVEADNAKLRAELARLTAPGSEGSLDNGELVAAITRGGSYRAEDFDVLDLQEAYRLGVAHERATHARSTDAVYRERDILAALAAKLAQRLGYPAWTAEHDLAADPKWEPEWKDIVFFRLPTGQCSWHLKAGEKAECSLDSLPVAVESWDGHTTEEKYARILAFLSQDERARQAQPAKDRATDEELERIFFDGVSHSTNGIPLVEQRAAGLRAAGLRAVAARVRQERCLVAQAVGRGWCIYLCPQKNEPSKWDIETGRVIAGRSDGGAILHGVPASDVPATLARLLGEVSRGRRATRARRGAPGRAAAP